MGRVQRRHHTRVRRRDARRRPARVARPSAPARVRRRGTREPARPRVGTGGARMRARRCAPARARRLARVVARRGASVRRCGRGRRSGPRPRLAAGVARRVRRRRLCPHQVQDRTRPRHHRTHRGARRDRARGAARRRRQRELRPRRGALAAARRRAARVAVRRAAVRPRRRRRPRTARAGAGNGHLSRRDDHEQCDRGRCHRAARVRRAVVEGRTTRSRRHAPRATMPACTAGSPRSPAGCSRPASGGPRCSRLRP